MFVYTPSDIIGAILWGGLALGFLGWFAWEVWIVPCLVWFIRLYGRLFNRKVGE